MLRTKLLIALVSALAPVAAWGQTGDSDLDTTDVVDLANLRDPSAIEARLRHVIADHNAELARIVRNGTLRRGYFNLAAGDSLDGNLLVTQGKADIFGVLRGSLVTLDGNVAVHRGGSVSGDILVLNGAVKSDSGTVGGTVRAFGRPTEEAEPAEPPPSKIQVVYQRLTGTTVTFLVLLALGLGLLVFAHSKLDVVAETASHSFGRSLLVGFVGQALLLPTFGILIAGLVVSIVGILLLPFMIVGYFLLAAIGLAGGYVAVARALGETYTQRQLAAGTVVSRSSYHRLLLGLGVLAAPWVAWALLHWVPVAGSLLWAVAFLMTWAAVTVGFGAMMLSRAGYRTNFSGRER